MTDQKREGYVKTEESVNYANILKAVEVINTNNGKV